MYTFNNNIEVYKRGVKKPLIVLIKDSLVKKLLKNNICYSIDFTVFRAQQNNKCIKMATHQLHCAFQKRTRWVTWFK